MAKIFWNYPPSLPVTGKTSPGTLGNEFMFKMSLAQQLGGTGRWVFEFEVNLLYIVTSRTARTTELKPCQ